MAITTSNGQYRLELENKIIRVKFLENTMRTSALRQNTRTKRSGPLSDQCMLLNWQTNLAAEQQIPDTHESLLEMYADVIAAKQRRFLSALTIAFLAICLTPVPAVADDDSLCAEATGQKSIESCTRLIDAALASGETADDEKLARLYYWRGYANAELGQRKSAIFDFTSAIEHNPRMPSAYQYRGLAFQRDRKFDRSIVDFNIAISLSPTDPEIYFDRGYSRTNLNQFKRAIQDFTKVIENNAKFVSDAYNMRGYAYALSGDIPNGLKDFKQAVTLALTTANFRHSLGEGYFYSGSREKALVEWKRACQIATAEDTREWHKSLAKLGYYSGDIDQSCNEHTLKAFEVCAQTKCRF